MNFIFWKIILFLLIPFASAASIVDESYKSNREDVYDAIINTLFPITFVVLTKVSGEESGKIKRILLPLLDDILYNTVTWVIPLIVSFAYDDFLVVKTCVFVLVLSLTRNISYFTDEVPKDFLATSTTFTQWGIQQMLSDTRKDDRNDDEINKFIEKMKNNGEMRKLIKKMIKEDERQ